MKIDLHRHVGGSIKAHTIFEILKRQGMSTYYTVEEVAREITFRPDEQLSFQNFLNKFQILDTITWDEKAISQVIKQVVYDLVKEQIDYCELKFTIDKYSKHTQWADVEVIRFIHKEVQEQATRWGVLVGLVLSLKYESDRHRQRQVSKLIENADVAQCLVGIDLVGDERHFDAEFYADLLADWRKAGKGLQAHAGESAKAENVRTAIDRLGVHRIAHGILAADSPDIISLAKERGICFDVAITSNVKTGVVKSYAEHPVKKMLDQGCKVTIGTDDPVTLGIDLNHEYEVLQKTFEVSDSVVMEIMENSYKHAFTRLEQDER